MPPRPDHDLAALVDERRGPATALVAAGHAVSYDELAKTVRGWAALLRDHGAGPGRCVAVALPNSTAYVAAYFATLRLGAAIAPLGVLLRPREVAQRLALVRPVVLVATPAAARELSLVAHDAGADFVAAEPGEMPRHDDVPAFTPSADDVAALLFTSGTTGTAKAAALTHGALTWNARAIVDAFALTSDDVQLAAAPLSHVLGMTGIMNATLTTGGAIALMERFDPAGALTLMRESATTGVMGAPPMFVALVREARAAGGAPRLRFAHGGGAAFATEVSRAVADTFGTRVREGYGMTEVGGGISVTSLAMKPRPRSVGRAFPDSEIRVVELHSRTPLPPGETGEVQVRSPSVMRGYHDDPAATAAVVDADGWLSTGDVGYLDTDGYLFLVDRRKELIIRSGYNVYPGEVEEVLYSCPGVEEVAVVGVAHPDCGEEVVAVVVASPDRAVDPTAVTAFARERLAAYKYPRHVVLAEALPKGPTGKIAKREIDRAALARRLGFVGGGVG